jgi:ribosomal protein L3 glutamine methyltransferase
VQSDLFDGLGDARYDVIVSKPPYVTTEAMAALSQEYRHEPALALAAGADGLDVVRRILRESKGHLQDGGVLIVEVGDGREAVEAAFPELPFTWLETAGAADQVFLLERGQLAS